MILCYKPIRAVTVGLGVALMTLTSNIHIAIGQVNGLGSKPFQGWSSWTQESVLGEGWLSGAQLVIQSDSLKSTGLQAHGYSYINIDSGWASNIYDTNGRPMADSGKFSPTNGTTIQAVISHIHANGQKAGIYFLPGVPQAAYAANGTIAGTTYTIQSICVPNSPGNAWPLDDAKNEQVPSWVKIDYTKPGAQEYVSSIVNLFASWGIDFIKMDFVVPGSNYNSLIIDNRPDVAAWSKAIKSSARPMWLALSNALDHNYVQNWEATSNSRRIETDVECYCSHYTDWSHASNRFSDLVGWQSDVGSTLGWNDLDSLDVGAAFTGGLTLDERQSIMSLWSIANAPLYIGDNLTKLDAYGKQLLTNDSVIAVDQSQKPGVQVTGGTTPVWSSPRAKSGSSTYNLALFNLNASPATVQANWSDLGLGSVAHVCDLWASADKGNQTSGFSSVLSAHASAMIRVSSDISPAGPQCFGKYMIVNQNSNEVIDDNNSSTAPGTPMQQYPQNAGANQQWIARPSGASWVFINVASGLVLDIPGSSNTQNTQIDQGEGNGSGYQQWTLNAVGDGSYEIVSAANGLALDVRGASKATSAAIIEYPYHNGTNQHWVFRAIQ